MDQETGIGALYAEFFRGYRAVFGLFLLVFSQVDLVLPRGPVHPVQDRPDPQWGRADRGPGQGVQWGPGLRLLLGLSSLPTRVRRVAPVLSGAPDPRCEVPGHVARSAGAGRWGAVA